MSVAPEKREFTSEPTEDESGSSGFVPVLCPGAALGRELDSPPTSEVTMAPNFEVSGTIGTIEGVVDAELAGADETVGLLVEPPEGLDDEPPSPLPDEIETGGTTGSPVAEVAADDEPVAAVDPDPEERVFSEEDPAVEELPVDNWLWPLEAEGVSLGVALAEAGEVAVELVELVDPGAAGSPPVPIILGDSWPEGANRNCSAGLRLAAEVVGDDELKRRPLGSKINGAELDGPGGAAFALEDELLLAEGRTITLGRKPVDERPVRDFSAPAGPIEGLDAEDLPEVKDRLRIL